MPLFDREIRIRIPHLEPGLWVTPMAIVSTTGANIDRMRPKIDQHRHKIDRMRHFYVIWRHFRVRP